jgi:Conjugative transposon protein TcpC
MARRSTLDRGPQPDYYEGGLDAPASGQKAREKTPWRGAGGRWAVWTLRVIIWVVLIVIGARGIIAIALNQKTPATSSGAAASGSPSSKFPSSAAEAYAQAFASVYLNASQSGQAKRAKQLADFLPKGSDSQLGWNKAGSLTLQSDQVAGISVQDSHHAVVTLLARVNDQLMELGVPIYTANGAMVVSGEPAWLGAPPRATPPHPAAKPGDSSTEVALTAQLPGFFQAYASGNQPAIAKFLAHGASVTGLGGALTFSSISSLYVPVGGSTRQITVGVVWLIPGQSGAAPAQLQMTYDMTVVSQNANWYVQSIQAATTQPTGQKS